MDKTSKKAARVWSDSERQELQLLDFIRSARVSRDKLRAQLAWLDKCAPGENEVGRGRAALGQAGGKARKVRVEPPRSIDEPARVVQG